MTTLIIRSCHPKYASKVNRAYTWLRKYYALVDIEDENRTAAIERKQENAYDKYECIMDELPKREQNAVKSQHKAFHGYEG